MDHLKKIDIVIPCAGIGSRLGVLTKNQTKNMLNINGLSILEHQLKTLFFYKKKINKVHFILGYKSKILKAFILKLKLPFVVKFYINKDYLKSACAISIIPVIQNLKNSALFINSDLILKKKNS